MNNPARIRGSVGLVAAAAVLVAAPAAETLRHGLWMLAAWIVLAALAGLAQALGRRVLADPTAAALASTVVCTATAAGLLILQSLAPPPLSGLSPTSLTLLALVAGLGAAMPWRRQGFTLGLVAVALLATGVLRGALPPMAPGAAAALALALLGTALACIPHAGQNSDTLPNRHERQQTPADLRAPARHESRADD